MMKLSFEQRWAPEPDLSNAPDADLIRSHRQMADSYRYAHAFGEILKQQFMEKL